MYMETFPYAQKRNYCSFKPVLFTLSPTSSQGLKRAQQHNPRRLSATLTPARDPQLPLDAAGSPQTQPAKRLEPQKLQNRCSELHTPALGAAAAAPQPGGAPGVDVSARRELRPGEESTGPAGEAPSLPGTIPNGSQPPLPTPLPRGEGETGPAAEGAAPVPRLGLPGKFSPTRPGAGAPPRPPLPSPAGR